MFMYGWLILIGIVVASSAYVAASGNDGWGWFLFLAFVMVASTSYKKDNDKNDISVDPDV